MKRKRKKEKAIRRLKASRPGTQSGPLDPDAFVRQVENLALPLCVGEGLELVHVEFRNVSGGRILRITIDGPSGVTLDDCALVSRQLSDLLDVAIDEECSYNLEVSSPGVDRPLGP